MRLEFARIVGNSLQQALPSIISAVAGLLGAFIGALVVTLKMYFERREERQRARDKLVQRYLVQLQDAVESLWYRLNNLANRGGRAEMDDEYFGITMLYALGRVLAIERIFALEGVQPELDRYYPSLARDLQNEPLDTNLEGIGFYKYNRLALAEAIMQRDGQGFRTGTFLEFRKLYEPTNSSERQWLDPAKKAVFALPPKRINELLDLLHRTSVRLASATKVKSKTKDLKEQKHSVDSTQPQP